MTEKQVDPARERAKQQAQKFNAMSEAATRLGILRERLAFTRMLLVSEASAEARVIILFDDRKDPTIRGSIYGSHRDAWKKLASEPVSSSVPLLGVAETALREQIRKQENLLRDMGVTDV